MKIGVLALQGAFVEHERALIELRADPVEIRNLQDFQEMAPSLSGIILPGGESTTMGRLLRELGLLFPLKRAIQEGLPVFGTCAGLILLAKSILSQEETHLSVMDIQVERNAYGRQLSSFETEGYVEHVGDIPMTFIRGPIIRQVGADVEVLAEVDGNIVAARQKKILVTAFHPELTEDRTLHRFFLEEMCI